MLNDSETRIMFLKYLRANRIDWYITRYKSQGQQEYCIQFIIKDLKETDFKVFDRFFGFCEIPDNIAKQFNLDNLEVLDNEDGWDGEILGKLNILKYAYEFSYGGFFYKNNIYTHKKDILKRNKRWI